MKTFYWELKMEGLLTSNHKNMEIVGEHVKASDFTNAAKVILEIGKLQYGEAKKVTITMTEI